MAQNTSSARQFTGPQFHNKNETRKLTDRYIKGTEANGSGQVTFLSFADKIQEKIEKYKNEILAYANPDTKTDLKLADLFDGNTVTFKLILNTDEFGCNSPVTARLILFGLLWLTYHRNYELHLITFFCVPCGMAKEVYTGIRYLSTILLKYRKTGRVK